MKSDIRLVDFTFKVACAGGSSIPQLSKRVCICLCIGHQAFPVNEKHSGNVLLLLYHECVIQANDTVESSAASGSSIC